MWSNKNVTIECITTNYPHAFVNVNVYMLGYLLTEKHIKRV